MKFTFSFSMQKNPAQIHRQSGWRQWGKPRDFVPKVYGFCTFHLRQYKQMVLAYKGTGGDDPLLWSAVT